MLRWKNRLRLGNTLPSAAWIAEPPRVPVDKLSAPDKRVTAWCGGRSVGKDIQLDVLTSYFFFLPVQPKLSLTLWEKSIGLAVSREQGVSLRLKRVKKAH